MPRPSFLASGSSPVLKLKISGETSLYTGDVLVGTFSPVLRPGKLPIKCIYEQYRGIQCYRGTLSSPGSGKGHIGVRRVARQHLGG